MTDRHRTLAPGLCLTINASILTLAGPPFFFGASEETIANPSLAGVRDLIRSFFGNGADHTDRVSTPRSNNLAFIAETRFTKSPSARCPHLLILGAAVGIRYHRQESANNQGFPTLREKPRPPICISSRAGRPVERETGRTALIRGPPGVEESLQVSHQSDRLSREVQVLINAGSHHEIGRISNC